MSDNQSVLVLNEQTHNAIQITGTSASIIYLLLATRYQYLHIMQLKKRKKLKVRSTVFYSTIMIAFGLAYCINTLLWNTFTDHHDTEQCRAFYFVGVAGMTGFKLTLYHTLCLRLSETFRNTGVYSRCFLIFWLLFTTIGSICSASMALVFVTYSTDVTPCRLVFPPWLIAVFSMYDLTACIVNVVLFTYPLCRMVNMVEAMQSTHSGDRKDVKIRYLIRKTAILGSVSVLSSVFFISLIAVLDVSSFWMSMDVMFTMTFIILLFQRNENIFDCCCGCLMGKLRKDGVTSECSRCHIGFDTLLRLLVFKKEPDSEEHKLKSQMSSTEITETSNQSNVNDTVTSSDHEIEIR